MLNVFPKLMGRNHFACAIMVKAGRGAYNSNKLALTPSELLNLWERIHRTKSFGKLLTGHEGFRMEITRMPGNLTQKLNCGAGSAVISIDANGDVYPCHLLMSKQFLAGNIKEQNFWEIYASSDILKSIRAISVNTIEKCRNCFLKYFCGDVVLMRYTIMGRY